MFGISYLKVPATTFVLLYKNGRVVRKGTGLSFFYFALISWVQGAHANPGPLVERLVAQHLEGLRPLPSTKRSRR